MPDHDRWTCPHCGRRFAVPTLTDDHTPICPQRPKEPAK